VASDRNHGRCWLDKAFKKIPFPPKFVLSYLPLDKLATKRGSFPGLNSGRGPQNHFLTAVANLPDLKLKESVRTTLSGAISYEERIISD
jgi:hypothetical protein